MSELESKIQKYILDYLNQVGVAWKMGVGAFKSNGHYVKLCGGFNEARGAPDIYFAYKGHLWCAEIKTPKGSLSNDQVFFHETVKSKGQYEIKILKSLPDAIEWVEEINCIVERKIK